MGTQDGKVGGKVSTTGTRNDQVKQLQLKKPKIRKQKAEEKKNINFQQTNTRITLSYIVLLHNNNMNVYFILIITGF